MVLAPFSGDIAKTWQAKRSPRLSAETTAEAFKKAQRFATRAGVEALLVPPRPNVDDVHRPVALSGDEQFVAAECHVHWLIADLDGGLLAK
jgi:hypothetical protein